MLNLEYTTSQGAKSLMQPCGGAFYLFQLTITTFSTHLVLQVVLQLYIYILH